jgi:hypothetical protein
MNFIYHIVFLHALIYVINAEELPHAMGEPMDEEAKLIDTKNSTVWGPGKIGCLYLRLYIENFT